MIDSHKGSGDEQNQRVSGATRINSGRTGAAAGYRPLKRRKMGKRLQHTAQRTEIQSHLETSARLLGEVVAQENAEREKIRANLKDFHSTIGQCTAEITTIINLDHQSKMDAIKNQSEKMRAALQNQDVKSLEEVLKQLQDIQ